MIFLFPDFNKNEILTIPVVLPDKLLSDFALYEFIFQIPPHTNSYLVCFKAEACAHGVLHQSSTNVDKAMCLAGWGMRDLFKQHFKKWIAL
jgi:hypothetical protein